MGDASSVLTQAAVDGPGAWPVGGGMGTMGMMGMTWMTITHWLVWLVFLGLVFGGAVFLFWVLWRGPPSWAERRSTLLPPGTRPARDAEVREETAGNGTKAGARRRLAAVFSADVAGFGRLMGGDEEGTLRTLHAHREVMDGLITLHGGRVVTTAGDSVLAEFASVVEAVASAVEVQRRLAERNAGLPADRRLEFRIGINLGDVIVGGEDIYGDGVNVAARVQELAEPGGVSVSGNVYEQVRGKLPLLYEDLGDQRVKNIAEPVRTYRVRPATPARAEASALPDRPSEAPSR